MPNPDWKYGDILRPAPGVRGWAGPGDRILFLTGDYHLPGYFVAVNLTIDVDNETWVGDYEKWEPDTDA